MKWLDENLPWIFCAVMGMFAIIFVLLATSYQPEDVPEIIGLITIMLFLPLPLAWYAYNQLKPDSSAIGELIMYFRICIYPILFMVLASWAYSEIYGKTMTVLQQIAAWSAGFVLWGAFLAVLAHMKQESKSGSGKERSPTVRGTFL